MLEIRTAFNDRCIGNLLMFIRLMLVAQGVFEAKGFIARGSDREEVD